jgi:hypothetical protein
MARPMRLDIEGGWYSVVNQGIEIRVISEVVPEEHFIERSAQLLGSLYLGRNYSDKSLQQLAS